MLQNECKISMERNTAQHNPVDDLLVFFLRERD